MDTPPPPANRNLASGSGSIALAIVAAALILAWSGGDEEPRYQLAASGSAVYRMDTDSGEIIGCTTSGCARVQAPDRAKTLDAINLRLPGGREQEAQPPAAQNAAD